MKKLVFSLMHAVRKVNKVPESSPITEKYELLIYKFTYQLGKGAVRGS